MFKIAYQYTKNEIYTLLNVPIERQRGAWDKGYHIYDGNIFIFSNVGIPGRTGHDYNNYWDGDLFVWEAALKSHINQPQIKKMLYPSPSQKIFLFTREKDRDPFTYEGEVVVKEFKETTPVKITWKFKQYPYDTLEESKIPTVCEDGVLYEGKLREVSVNKYERNPLARRICIAHHGAFCHVCDFDFYRKYGELGKGYIHVHHIIPIASIKETYLLVPEDDLIPICPNCHSMVHKQSPPLSLNDLKEIIEKFENYTNH